MRESIDDEVRRGRSMPITALTRRDKGIAVIMVVLVLAGLLALAGPFALSMFMHERQARHFRDSARARLAAEGAVAHAMSVLRRTDDDAEKAKTYGAPWVTPDFDTAAEFDVRFESTISKKARKQLKDAGMSTSFDDPKGVMWSVRIEDEQGKINLVSSPPLLVGNLIGSASLTADMLQTDPVAPLDDASFFFTDGDAKTVDGQGNIGISAYNRFSYTLATDTVLEGIRFLDPVRARKKFLAGQVVYDAVALDITQAAFNRSFRSVYDMKGKMRPQDFERVVPDVTVNSYRDSSNGWFRKEEVLSGFISTTEDITVKSAEGLGSGTRIRLRVNGSLKGDMNRVISARGSNDRWALGLERGIGFDRQKDDIVHVEGEQRHPINVNTASRSVLAACFTGVGYNERSSVRREEAEVIADFVHGYVRGDYNGRACASIANVKLMLEAFKTAAVDGIGIDGNKINALIENANVMNSTRLQRSTTTFCYKSYGNFSIEAAGVVNTPAGEESAKYVLRQLLTMPTGGGGDWVVSSQKDFDEQIGRNVGRKVVTWPFMSVPSAEEDQQTYALGLDQRTGVDPEGHLTLDTGQTGNGRPSGRVGPPAEHFDGNSSTWRGQYTLTHEGAKLSSSLVADAKTLLRKGRRDDCEPFYFEAWMRGFSLNASAQRVFIAGNMTDNGVMLTYHPRGNRTDFGTPGTQSEFVLTISDSCSGQGAAPWMGPARFRFIAPDQLDDKIWYHVAFHAGGTSPYDALVWLDGVPLMENVNNLNGIMGNNSASFRPGTTLTSPLVLPSTPSDVDLNECTVNVDSTADFPPSGAILVDSEVFEYVQKTANSFVNCRRARRSTHMAEHFAAPTPGALVIPYGYSIDLQETLFRSTAVVVGDVGRGPRSDIGPESRLIEEKEEHPTDPTREDVFSLLAEDDAVIPVVDASQFQDSGFAYMRGKTLPAEEPALRSFQDKTEYVYYAGVDRRTNMLTGCMRKQWPKIMADLGGQFVINKREFLLDGETVVRQISIATKNLTQDFDLVPTYQDDGGTRYIALKANALGRAEWIRYEHKETQTDANGQTLDYVMGWHQRRWNPDVWGPRDDWQEWRVKGKSNSLLRDNGIPDGTQILPVVRVNGPQCGDYDSPIGYEKVTVVSGTEAELNPVTINHAYAWQHAWNNPNGQRGHSFTYRVSFDNLTSTRKYQPRSRLLKFPTGELLRKIPSTMSVGSGGMTVDEIRGASYGRRSALLALRFRDPPALSDPRSIPASAADIEVMSDITMNADVTPANGIVGTRDVHNKIVLRIGNELVYADNAPVSDTTHMPWGSEQFTKLKHCRYNEDEHTTSTCTDARGVQFQRLPGCDRGFFGTTARIHAAGSRIVFLENLPLTKVTGIDDDTITLEDGSWFPDEGYAFVSQKMKPWSGEIVGWTRRQGQNSFSGCEYLHGRYGSRANAAMVGDPAFCLPFRYWDRYAAQCPEDSVLALFSASYSARGAEWHSIEWEEKGAMGAMDGVETRVLCRFDGKPDWAARPSNRSGGLWEFVGDGTPHYFRAAGGGALIADGIEVRVMFKYKSGAYGNDRNDWKMTPALNNLVVKYGSPLVVRKVDLLDY